MKLLRISNEDNFNILEIEKSNSFIDNLQEFVIKVGLVETSDLTSDYKGEKFDFSTYHTIYNEAQDSIDSEPYYVRAKIDEIPLNKLVRYHKNDKELIIIFHENMIRLIYYVNEETREKINNFILKL